MSIHALKQNKAVILRQEGDEALLFNPATSDIVTINSTGCYIWELFNDKLTEQDILKELVDRFEVTREQAEKDLNKFIADLKNGDFISLIK
jgi:hypothetical protein